MSNRGIISFKLGGIEFDLVPSLENLDNLETATNKPIYMVALILNYPTVSKLFYLVQSQNMGKHQLGLMLKGVYEQICKDKMIMDISLQVVVLY